MKALIISPRFPWPPYTGDRLRTTIWLTALAREGTVTLVAPDGDVPVGAPRFSFFPATASLKQALRALTTLIRDRIPLQCMLTGPYDWRAALEQARADAGPFDVTVVVLSRMHPWVHASLEGRTVLDAIDSLQKNAKERAKAAAAPLRWLWRTEQKRMARIEENASRLYDRVLVVTEEEASEFGNAEAVPTGVEVGPPSFHPRAFDFGFWGRLPYFANRDAANWLLDEIWPAIRALRPAATLIVGGAEASKTLRRHAQRSGIVLVSPIDDVAVFARNIRVALMPLRFGTGQSGKILEAAEAGCAIVGTPQALRGLAPLAAFARIETTTSGFAKAAVELVTDPAALLRSAAQLRDVIELSYTRSVTRDRLSAIARERDRS